ncbi:MAG TPA: carboxylating nicotinate-nucleotide diphosphorylase [Nitrososphaeraceae archaeon]
MRIHTSLKTRRALTSFLLEDIGTGDITTNNLNARDTNVRAEIVVKSDDETVVAGLEEAIVIFDICGCTSRNLVDDGSFVRNYQGVLEIEGRAKDILKAERTALNMLMRMSGIATETRTLIEAIRSAGSVAEITSTRKTCPGLRTFDKKAVKIGGGLPHRQRLDEMVLIKSNHIYLAGSVERCIRELKEKCGSNIKIECEVTNLKDLITAINEGSDIVMLDNFEPVAAKNAIKTISNLGLRKRSIIEISGGIRFSNIKDYADAGPDRISVGYLTHSTNAANYSLKIVDRNEQQP